MIILTSYAKTGFSNTYVLAADDNGAAAIVDPGFLDPTLLEQIEQHGLSISAVLLTHTHPAHAAGVGTVLRIYHAEVYAFAEQVGDVLTTVVRDGAQIDVGALSFQVCELPGHSLDSVGFRLGNLVFTGDALGAGSVGSTPSAEARIVLVEALRRRVLSLPEATVILPGHGPPSTVQVERTFNPALQR